MKKKSVELAGTPQAIIYCRVSSPRQKTEGHGLESQEHRCRQFADQNDLEVVAVFPDDISGGGDFMKRPGIVALLSYLDAQPGKRYVIIFDDLKRFARDTEFHWRLRREFRTRGAEVVCLNLKLEDSPEGKFVETMFAATGELERSQNQRQVIQKMTARLERGYAVFAPPIGYKYAADREHGKILVRVEPVASILVDALESFASGHLQTKGEVKHFLDARPAFSKDTRTGKIYYSRVERLLSNIVYAGYIEMPAWGVSPRKGHHEPLISLETFELIQKRLNGNPKAPVRKDINEDFPLRGFVLCDDCGRVMTACWSKGRSKHYPYYLCDTEGCENSRKSIPRDKIEGGFAEILQSLQPTRELFGMAKTMFIDAWEMRTAEANRDKGQVENQRRSVEKQIQTLLERIIETGSASVIKAYEDKIEKLERERLLLEEKVGRIVPPPRRLGEFIEPALALLANPWNIYDNGNLTFKRAVLRLVFAEPVRYSRKSGYRTANTTFPFKVLASIASAQKEMVRPRGVEPLFTE
ncbi:recombinase family protein [Rhizobium leguminosarum]|uniref:recombinase family protein n=1 Tax=Rhizobium leguminosarum TaxID=384 RepID=UPI003D7C1B1D